MPAMLRAMESMESAPVYRTEVMSEDELIDEIYDPEARSLHPRFKPEEEGGVFKYPPMSEYFDRSAMYAVVRENKEIVGLAKIKQSPHDEGVFWLMSISVDKTRKGEGISNKVLEEVFSYAKSEGKKLLPSTYTEEGAERIKHQIERLGQKYGVEIVGNNR